MEIRKDQIELLKHILENIRTPETLETHPWSHSLVVQEMVASNPDLEKNGGCVSLIFAVSGLFSQMMPSSPPRHGKRLDTRWGEFGVLAALYFAPLNCGTPCPSSLRDAWGRIDEAILLFVFGKTRDQLSYSEIETYKLVGDELEVGPISTISDWHQKGIQRLLEIIRAREQQLELSFSMFPGTQNSGLKPIAKNSDNASSSEVNKHRKSGVIIIKRITILVLSLLCLMGLFSGGVKAWRIYTLGQKVRQDILELQDFKASLDDLDAIETVGPRLVILRADIQTFRHEAAPLLWLSVRCGWVPVYGGDLAFARELLDLADYLSASVVEAYQAAYPIIQVYRTRENKPALPETLQLLEKSQVQFKEARSVFDQALISRKKIEVQHLSSFMNNIVIDHIDPVLAIMDDGLSVATSLPILLGASSDGPKTYLVLAQNEDELRPTGGFITAVANLVIQDGEIMHMEFEDSGELDDWSKPYPAAPWQLKEYMNSQILVLRDSNWYTDFPTTALWVEYLYAYNRSHSVDGVIAFDQYFLTMVLKLIGPISIDGVSYPITTDNVSYFMRHAKVPPPDNVRPADWKRKTFLNPLAEAVIDKVVNNGDLDLQALLKTIIRALDERHLIIKVDDPTFTSVVQKHGWDDAVRPGDGDYLMVVDTNIGFNKTNALVEGNLFYDIDLTDLAHPTSNLTVVRKNNASDQVPCVQWDEGVIPNVDYYPTDRCYWNYLRVYTVKGTEIIYSIPPLAIPDVLMINDRSMPAPRVDVLDEEIEGVQGFGTLMVVPGGRSISANFHFGLPTTILSYSDDTGGITYQLKIQKQPGTVAVPITVRIHLPVHSTLYSVSNEAIVQDNDVLIKSNLRTDIVFEVIFSKP
jgi:hypothetical protein